MNANGARTIGALRLVRIIQLRPHISMALCAGDPMPVAGSFAFICVYLRFLLLLAEAGYGRTNQNAGAGRFPAPCVGLSWC
jgi:hypothetical protein